MRSSTLARLGKFGFQSYEDYLDSPLWTANKARLNLPRCCWICGTNRSLQAHHCSYENICAEKPGDLIVLCDGHHKDVHRLGRTGIPLAQCHIELKKDPKQRQAKKKTSKKAKRRKKKDPGYVAPKGPGKHDRISGEENERLHRIQVENKKKREQFKQMKESSSLLRSQPLKRGRSY